MQKYFSVMLDIAERLYQTSTTYIARTLAHAKIKPLKNYLIQYFLNRFHVQMDEAVETNPFAYESFNAFFTRALKATVRPYDNHDLAINAPVDGTISQIGTIEDHTLMQAKGMHYTLEGLMGTPDTTKDYTDGKFTTIYLAPTDYHRIHMPCTGHLIRMDYIPGRLFSVRPEKIATVENIFARNERLVCHFMTPHGPFALVMVGAQLVSGLETVWHGKITNKRAKTWHYDKQPIVLNAQQEMGRFNFGSTVILCFSPGITWSTDLQNNQSIQLGTSLGTFTAKESDAK